MHASRLGKFVIVLAGAIGLLYVGGGRAHADTVSVNNVSLTNNSSASQSTGGTSASVITSNSTHQDNSANPSATISTPDAGSQSPTDVKTIPVVANSEVAQTDGSKADPVAAVPDQSAGTTDVSIMAIPVVGSTTPPITAETTARAAYYPPRQVQPVVLSSSQNPPLATAHDEHGTPKPEQPTMPQGAFVLVSTVGAPSPVVKFLGGLAGLQALHHMGVTDLLVLILALLFGLVTSAFLSHLRASGYSIAPRGSTPQFNFAFPVGESHLSNKLKRDSLFSTPQRLLGGWWYQGGRI